MRMTAKCYLVDKYAWEDVRKDLEKLKHIYKDTYMDGESRFKSNKESLISFLYIKYNYSPKLIARVYEGDSGIKCIWKLNKYEVRRIYASGEYVLLDQDGGLLEFNYLW
jgi:hypothetical protein